MELKKRHYKCLFHYLSPSSGAKLRTHRQNKLLPQSRDGTLRVTLCSHLFLDGQRLSLMCLVLLRHMPSLSSTIATVSLLRHFMSLVAATVFFSLCPFPLSLMLGWCWSLTYYLYSFLLARFSFRFVLGLSLFFSL